MLRSRFLWKLFAGIVALILTLGLALLVLGHQGLSRQARAIEQLELETRATAGAAFLAEALASGQDRVDAINDIAVRLGVGLELLDSSGARVVASALPESGAAGVLVSAATPLVVSRDVGAGLREAMVVAYLPRPESGVRGSFWLIGLGMLAAGVLIALWFARRVTGPIRSVASAADALSRGRLGSRIVIRSNDEIGDLAVAFNEARDRMLQDLDALTGERNQLNAVLSGMSDGVLAVDEDERVLHINEVARRLLGVEASADVVGRPILEVTRDALVLKAIIATLENGEEFHGNSTRIAGEQEIKIDLSAGALPAKDGSGVGGSVMVLHDVTRLERLEGLRRDFVSNVSHELKTPLTAIRGFVETLLESEGVDEATQRRFLGRIKLQTTRLSDLVGDLLSLSRIESGNMEIAERPIDLRVIVSETLPALRPASDRREIELEVDLPELPVPVFGEGEALRQALTNLIGNAIKYSDEGSRVRVRLSSVDGQALFEVEDEGPGIAHEQQERIFERFYRVDKGRSRNVGGTGLGLAIVKNVASSLGGSVQLDSEVGRGSIFRMILPIASASEAAASA